MNRFIDAALPMIKSIFFRALVIVLILGLVEALRRVAGWDDLSYLWAVVVACGVAFLARFIEGVYDIYRAKEGIMHEADVPIASRKVTVTPK